MKWLLVLAAAVFVLLLAWFLVGRSGPPELAPEAYAVLEIPAPTAGKPEIIKAAQQFLKIDPRSVSMHEGCALLRVVAAGLDDADWPQVQAATFRGFSVLGSMAGSRENLEPVLDRMLARFARFGSVAELETLIAAGNGNAYWKSNSDRALLEEASREVSASESGEVRLHRILEAAVRQKDYARAGEYASKARFAEGVADAVIAPVKRLETALRLYHESKGEKPPMAAVVKDWASASEDRLSAPVHLSTGLELARSGQHALDFSRLTAAMAETKSHERAAEYWEKVLVLFADRLPAQGAYVEAPALQALTSAFSAQFQKKTVECAFWKKLAERATHRTVGEGMWRVECLKHAFRASSDESEKVGLLKEIAKGYKSWMPGGARQNVEALAGQLQGDATKAEVAKVLEEVRATDAAHQLSRKKLEQEMATAHERSLVDSLKRQLAQAKANKGTPELIRKLEAQIKEYERKLPE